MISHILSIRNKVYSLHPLIHCITNPITSMQCANAVLAVGARPIMAEHPKEVSEITQSANALVLNLGNISDVRMRAMELAAETAKKLTIPIVVDAVGVSCSALRRTFAMRILSCFPTVIKGNYSEIYALHNHSYRTKGVDAEALSAEVISDAAVSIALQQKCTVLATGKEDIVTDGSRLFHMQNGDPQLASITGTGCMSGVLCGCFAAVSADIYAAVSTCAVLGISGELAKTSFGNGSFSIRLMDVLSVLTEEQIRQKLLWKECYC